MTVEVPGSASERLTSPPRWWRRENRYIVAEDQRRFVWAMRRGILTGKEVDELQRLDSFHARVFFRRLEKEAQQT